MKAKVILGLVLLAVVVLFTLQNTEVVALRFLWWEFAMSRVLMFLLAFGVGLLTGFLLGSHRRPRPPAAPSPESGAGF
jgi:uncharacterized integral membrane protein